MKLEATFDELRPGDVLLEADGCVVRQTGVLYVVTGEEWAQRAIRGVDH